MIYERYHNEFLNLSTADLAEVARALEDSTKARKKSEISALREEIAKKASLLGIDPKELISGRVAGASKRVGKKVDPKYRMHAPDGTVTEWSGRGMKPKAFAPYTKEELDARFAIRN